MLKAQTLHPQELGEAAAARWRELGAATPAFASPLLGPDFAQVIGAHRDDARVTVFERDGQAVGFFPHHRRPGGLARPIGAPLADYHALVTAPDPGFTGREALAAAGLSAWRFTGLVDPYGLFACDVAATADSYVVQLGSDGPAGYLEAVRAASPKKFKNYRRLEHKLEREVGDIRLVAPDHSRDAFEALVTWKREQLRRTGSHDFLAPAWMESLFERLFALRDGDFRGLMVCLYAGERLVAGQFGVRLGHAYHPWLASTDPDLAAYSPGQMFLSRAIAALPALQLDVFDLGPGHDHYKRPYALGRIV
ncbi:MAG TPA: GNAT family N-acetyltransferase, partial [Caulobacteraceae bacterium]|nr:GNAT family N-acetyltransferase [Caulobacteraceae bacterium]